MDVQDYRDSAARDRAVLDSWDGPDHQLRPVAARYHEAMEAIAFHDRNGRLPEWAM